MILQSLDIDVLEEEEVETLEKESDRLYVLNDDYNTFEHVIKTLVRVCKHTPTQAEQSAWIVHLKGECSVKEGDFEKLKPMMEAIHDAGIGAVIRK